MSSISFQRHYIDYVDSTNKELNTRNMVGGIDEGYLLATGFQSGGKGQGSSKWESEKNKNLLFSFLIKPIFLDVNNMFYITVVISLSIIDALRSRIESSDFAIKWPNDIYVRDQKLGGILIENSIKGSNIDRSIIGVGINVNQMNFVSDAPNPTSLTILNGGQEIELTELLDDFEVSFSKRYYQLQSGEYDVLLNDYLQIMYQRGLLKQYNVDGRVVDGTIMGVDSYGFLRMFIEDKDHSFDVKDISYL